jgi:hypothetical protein
MDSYIVMSQICDPFWCPTRMQLYKSKGQNMTIVDDVTIELPHTDVKHWNFGNCVGFVYEAEAVRQAIINSYIIDTYVFIYQCVLQKRRNTF